MKIGIARIKKFKSSIFTNEVLFYPIFLTMHLSVALVFFQTIISWASDRDNTPPRQAHDCSLIFAFQNPKEAGRKLNHPEFIVDGPNKEQPEMFFEDFRNLDPSKIVVTEKIFNLPDGIFVQTERESIQEITVINGEINVVVQLETNLPDGDIIKARRKLRLTNRGLYLEDGPFGMAGLMYSVPRHGTEYIDFMGNLKKWNYLGDYVLPDGRKFSGVFSLTSTLDSGIETSSYYAPGIGKVYSPPTKPGGMSTRSYLEMKP